MAVIAALRLWASIILLSKTTMAVYSVFAPHARGCSYGRQREARETMLTLEEAISSASTLTDAELDALLNSLTDEEARELAVEVVTTRDAARKEQQLLFYEPTSKDARNFHLSRAGQRILTGGTGSSKSETSLVDMVIRMTGEIPISLDNDYPREKIAPPIAARLVLRSFTTTWENSLKPKLVWDKWTGSRDGKKGHWGWIPKRFLIKGRWDESWSEKFRTLTLTNGSTLTVMSHDQEVSEQASASCHDIGIDEGCKEGMYRENLFRLREGGDISIAMTPPDDESASWDAAWIYDLYEKGLPGPGKDPSIDSFTLFTEHNRWLDQAKIEEISRGLSPEQREVRLHGRFMHLGGRIYKTYTDRCQLWCFRCNKIVLPLIVAQGNTCATCNGSDIVEFCHFIEPIEEAYRWPVIFCLDPHPRKPHAMAWFAVSPGDNVYEIQEMEIDEEPEKVREKVFEFEKFRDLNIVKRLIDPNMAESPSGTTNKRGRTVRDEFDKVGLKCDLADDNRETARQNLRSMLKPDPRTREPRFFVFNNCVRSNYMMNRYAWGEYTRYSAGTKDPKPIPMDKNDDFPAIFQYVANINPSYRALYTMRLPMKKAGRKGAY